MKPVTVISIVVIAAAAAVAAIVVDRSGRTSVATTRDKLPDRVIEGLEAKVNDVASIKVKRAGLDVTLNKAEGGGWTLAEKGGYPARLESIKQAVVGIASLRPVERKTAKAENYSKLGVQDPETKAPDGTLVGAAGPALVTLLDSKGATLASIIVGNQKPGASGGASEVFVRKAGDTQAWLADGNVSIPTDAVGWVERDILNIARERTKSGTIELPDGQTLAASREKAEDALFTVQNVPAGRELTSASAGEPIGYALTSLTLEDVAPAASIGFDGPLPEGTSAGPRAEFRTFDGLVIQVRTLIKDGKTWAKFDVAFDESAAAPPPAPPSCTRSQQRQRAAAARPQAHRTEARGGRQEGSRRPPGQGRSLGLPVAGVQGQVAGDQDGRPAQAARPSGPRAGPQRVGPGRHPNAAAARSLSQQARRDRRVFGERRRIERVWMATRFKGISRNPT